MSELSARAACIKCRGLEGTRVRELVWALRTSSESPMMTSMDCAAKTDSLEPQVGVKNTHAVASQSMSG